MLIIIKNKNDFFNQNKFLAFIYLFIKLYNKNVILLFSFLYNFSTQNSFYVTIDFCILLHMVLCYQQIECTYLVFL